MPNRRASAASTSDIGVNCLHNESTTIIFDRESRPSVEGQRGGAVFSGGLATLVVDAGVFGMRD